MTSAKRAESRQRGGARLGLVGVAGLVLVAGLGGCAATTKPPELLRLEKMRGEPAAMAAAKQDSDLVKKADRKLAEAQKHAEDGDKDDAVHDALLGEIYLKQAMASADQARARSRAAAATAELDKANEEQARLKRDLASVNEQVALLKRLQDQSTERRKLEEQLSAEKKQLDVERQKATAVEKIAEAELALKTADTVNASKHAKVPYSAAQDLLARAQQEMQQSVFQAAQISAEMAKKKADEASATAKPLHQQEVSAADERARAEALARDAAAIPGITVRRDTRGQLQRLVLPIRADELFARRATTIAAGKGAVLDQVAALIKKYPNFPVQVIGYTDSSGRSGELLARSLARAQAVASGLAMRGVDSTKLTAVSGQGAAEPISDNRTSSGRAANNRIEVIFLYQ